MYRTSDGQKDEMEDVFSFLESHFLYSWVTRSPPTADSQTSSNPSFFSAVTNWPAVPLSKTAGKLGSKRAITFSPDSSRRSTSSTPV
ncbi:hypothetical protein ES703_111769 [subsurface metagenome]